MKMEDRGWRIEDRAGVRIAVLSIFHLLSSILFSSAHAAAPSSAPSDPALDWMLSHPTTSPATTQSTTNPVSPLVDRQSEKTRMGTITLSDGSKLAGAISTTSGKPLRVYDDEAKQYVDVP